MKIHVIYVEWENIIGILTKDDIFSYKLKKPYKFLCALAVFLMSQYHIAKKRLCFWTRIKRLLSFCLFNFFVIRTFIQ